MPVVVAADPRCANPASQRQTGSRHAAVGRRELCTSGGRCRGTDEDGRSGHLLAPWRMICRSTGRCPNRRRLAAGPVRGGEGSYGPVATEQQLRAQHLVFWCDTSQCTLNSQHCKALAGKTRRQCPSNDHLHNKYLQNMMCMATSC